MGRVAQTDPAIARIIEGENKRQRDTLVMIASENYGSKAVLETQATVLQNKYAEGYPGRRYYGGCEFVDQAEALAIERAKTLFGAEHANVQPHSGAQANMEAYFALLEPGDTVMGLRLDQGGHLTHGSPVNFSSKFFKFVAYDVDKETERINYDQVARLAKEHRPKLIVAGYTAYPRLIDFPRFRQIADEVGAFLMVDMAHISGLIAGGAHPSPVPYADIVTSTTQKTLRGPRGGLILCKETHARKVDRAVFPFTQGGPFMHVIAAKAVCFGEAMKPEFRAYAHQVVENARVVAAELAEGGLRIVSGGTDNHLMLVDLTPLGLNGQEGEDALSRAGIIVNKNAIPYDPLPARVTSGLRVGTAALTSRGMKVPEMRQVAASITRVLRQPKDEKVGAQVREEVAKLAARFPVPGLDD